MIPIYIPTLKRLGKQTTWDNLPAPAREHALLVCPPEEVAGHKAEGRNAVACPAKGIAPTRDWIINHAAKREYAAMVMFDDDLTFQRRRASGKIDNCCDAETLEALKWMEETIVKGGYVHCGLSTRFLGFASKGDYAEPSRMMHALSYNPGFIKENKLSFALGDPQTYAIDDMFMTLQLLTLGYPNRVSLLHRISTNGSNKSGGASTWRTGAQQSENAERLAAAFPMFVKVRSKKAWAGMEVADMHDVTVQWVKALKHGQGKI